MEDERHRVLPELPPLEVAALAHDTPSPRSARNAASPRLRAATSPKVRRVLPHTSISRSGTASAMTSCTPTSDHSRVDTVEATGGAYL